MLLDVFGDICDRYVLLVCDLLSSITSACWEGSSQVWCHWGGTLEVKCRAMLFVFGAGEERLSRTSALVMTFQFPSVLPSAYIQPHLLNTGAIKRPVVFMCPLQIFIMR